MRNTLFPRIWLASLMIMAAGAPVFADAPDLWTAAAPLRHGAREYYAAPGGEFAAFVLLKDE